MGSPEEAGSERDVRARALQIGHERLADLRIGGELSEVNAAHPSFSDVLHEEHPPAEPAAGERGDEFFRAVGARRRRRFHHRKAGGRLYHKHPARPLRVGEQGVVPGADIDAEPPERSAAPVLNVREVPARFAAAAFLGTLEAAGFKMSPLRVEAVSARDLRLGGPRVAGLHRVSLSVDRHPRHPRPACRILFGADEDPV